MGIGVVTWPLNKSIFRYRFHTKEVNDERFTVAIVSAIL